MVIAARNLSKSFDGGQTYALDGVDLEIKPGEFVAVIGLSGAGKSTFLRCVNGTIEPSFGELDVLGQAVPSLRGRARMELKRRIGFIFQQFNLIKSITVLQNVLVGRIAYTSLWRSLTGLYSRQDKQLARDALASVGLKGRDGEKARNLSGGQQQRVAIARALVQNPEIILADEPMASLDPKLSEVVLDILDDVNRNRGITVLVNIHVLEYARKYARRIIAFRRGKVVFDGTPEQLTAEKVEEVYNV